MAFGIDDILAKAADAALAAAAEGVAEGLLKAVLSFLMTKDDLEKAVAEIEAYIGHEFEEFINDNVMVNTSSALAFLQNFANNPKERKYLESALEPLHAAEGWLNTEIARSGEDVLRKRYAEVVIYTTTSVALWYNLVLLDPDDKQNLADSITSLTNFLTRAITQIKKMELVTCGPIQDSEDDPIRDPGDPPGITWYHSSFQVSCLALENGGYYFDAGPSRVHCHGAAEKKRNQILADYKAAELKRQEKIYGPAEALIAQLKRMELP